MMKEKVIEYIKAYNEKINNKDTSVTLPGSIYFYGDDIIALPRDDGDCRYPYGEDGFNYWTYASGYIHCNEGLFSPFLRATEGSEPKISFFVGKKIEEKVIERYSILSVPILDQEPAELLKFCVFSQDATYYICESKDLITAVRTFVSQRKIYYSLLLINKLDEVQDIYTSSYFNPFLKNSLVENSTDRWFRQIEFNKEGNMGSFKLETYEEKDRGIMTTNFGLLECSVEDNKYRDGSYIKAYQSTTSRYEYVGGSRSSLHHASAVNNGSLSNTHHHTSFTETAICGDVIDIHLHASFRVDYVFSFAKNQIEHKYEEKRDYDTNFVEEEFIKLSDKTDKRNNVHVSKQIPSIDVSKKYQGQPLTFDFKDSYISDVLDEKSFNPFMKHLKKQVEFCSEIKGFVQLSHFSLIGIRDIFQAIEGYMFDQPQKAKAKMLEALSFTSPEGRLPRQYSLPKDEGDIPAMDLRPFIDQGVWVISTILTYIRLTKDYDFLEQVCGYYSIVDEHKHIAHKSECQDSVLSHMVKIMDYLLINRDHENTKCVLALYGDWNDALDGLGKSLEPNKEYGTGVSVMATLQVYQNLNEMIELLEHSSEIIGESHGLFEKEVDLIKMYEKAMEEIKIGLFTHAIDENRIVHGWGDKKSYMVGSLNDPDGQARDGLTSNAFWILSGLIKEDDFNTRKEMILKAYQRLNSEFGMKTFEPFFEKGTLGVGRIPNLPKGTAENGATYIHASMFGVMSLFAIGEPKLAWDELLKLIPLTHEQVSVSPYVVPNSYGLNETFGIHGESMADWQTGSSNVMLKTIIRFVIGFEPTAKGVYIQPSMYQPFKSQSMELTYLGKKLIINHKTSNKIEANNRRFTINKKVYEGQFDKYMNMKRLFITDSELKKMEDIINITVED